MSSQNVPSAPLAGRRLTARNIAGLARWLALRLRFRSRVHSGLFFLDRGAALQLGEHGRLEVGPGVRMLRDFTADVFGTLTIGSDVFFNRGAHVAVLQEVRIGNRCLFGERVSIHDEDHTFGAAAADVALPDRPMRSAPVRIGDDVWVGANATILSGVTIGDGAVVAAHAVVVADVPARSLVAGVPARIRRSWDGEGDMEELRANP